MKRIALLISLLLFSAPLYGADASLAEIMSALKKGYASMDDLHASFNQRTYVASLKREEKGAGELSLKKKGGSAMFHFNYVRPKQQIISNGKNVWYYLPDNRQVIMSDTAKLLSGGNGIAMSYLTGLGNLDADFQVKLLSPAPDKNGNYLLELIPKKQNPAVAKLHLYVPATAVAKAAESSEPFFPVSSSVLFDQAGNRTTIEYSKVRINGGVASDRFHFKPPAGVDIIKQ